ncbi:MAG: DNA translocase FtsK [Bacteroidales bacterium]|nr:DNA translocase FtsK [Bacteroidales bacterium]MDD4360943.1 DNA translocase FtsK [Bacteroidales bacterium]
MAVKKKASKEYFSGIRNSGFVRFWANEQTRFVSGFLLLIAVIYLSVLLVSFFFTGAADQSLVKDLSFMQLSGVKGVANWAGTFGAWLSNIIMTKWMGISSLFIAAFGLMAALKLMRVRTPDLSKAFFVCCFALIWLSLFFGFFFIGDESSQFLFLGGAHGYYISLWLQESIGWIGTFLLLLLSLIVFLVFTSKKTIPLLRSLFKMDYLKKKQAELADAMEEEDPDGPVDLGYTRPPYADDPQTEENGDLPFVNKEEEKFVNQHVQAEKDIDMDIIVPKGDENTKADEETEDETLEQIRKKKNEEYDALAELGEYDPKAELSKFKNPPLEILKQYDDRTVVNHQEQTENKRKIVDVLESFGIRISSIQATVGPTVTLYEIVPEPGIRITKIKGLENDIALNLAALGIRIIAPIPGKGTIGIEVPNRDPKLVSMLSLVQSRKFQETKYDLPVVLGKTIMNEVFMFDLCKMPHILIAGATGQGKSVGLNALIASLLYKKHPGELKFVMVDPKMVEFSIYSPIEKHYLAKLPGDDNKAIITDYTKVIQTLHSLTIEMDDRYKLLNLAHTRNIKEYNAKFTARRLNPEKGHKYMPYIVIIIDEFGDLIMTAGKEIELPIARIAQKARAVGIHMVIATQRPTTNIITGTIKANFPARLAYKVSSATDSRTILDANGANQLIGKGDSLFSQGNDVTRIQCAFVDTPEVIEMVEYISNQRAYPTAFELPEYVDENGGGGLSDVDLSLRDPLFEEAARLIVIHQQGSTSLIQRKFSIGYNRAGRIVDQLEAAGIIGPSEGSKARQVLVDDEHHLDLLLSNLNP